MIINTRNRLAGLLILSIFASCSNKNVVEDNTSTQKLKVAVVNYPLLFFTQTIGQEGIETVFPIPPGIDPAYWNPSVEDIANFQSADIILINGAGYARWINNVSLPASKIINTTAQVKEKYQTVSEGLAHSHGPEGEHTHTNYALLTWLDMSIAKSQAEAVFYALVEAIPEKEEEMRTRYVSLSNRLDLLHNDLNDALKVRNRYYASHPVYQYLASGYNIEITSVHWEPGEDLSSDQWLELEKLIENNGSDIMLWEGEPSLKTKSLLQEKGIESILFRPCANKPHEGDLITVMRSNIDALTRITIHKKG